MGHALDEALRVLKPAPQQKTATGPWRHGILDIRPRPGIDPEVAVLGPDGQEWLCGGMPGTPDMVARHAAAEKLVNQRIAEGSLKLVAQRQFDWVDIYDSADDLVESVLENWSSRHIPEDVALKLAQQMADAPQGATPFVRQPIGLRLLTPCNPGPK